MTLRRIISYVVYSGILFLSLAGPRFAAATTYDFSFYGLTPYNGGTVQLSGSGSFSSPTPDASIILPDLTGFSLNDTYAPSTGPGGGQWAYGLSDLNSFLYNGSLHEFALLTNEVLGIGPNPYQAALSISGFGPDQVNIVHLGLFGQATITSFTTTPEPSSLGLIVLCGLSLLGLARKKMLYNS